MVEFGQGPPVLAAPVERIAIERKALSRVVASEHEGSEPRDVRRRRGNTPRGLERPGFHTRLESVARQDWNAVEQAEAGPERRRKSKRHERPRLRTDGRRAAARV